LFDDENIEEREKYYNYQIDVYRKI